MPLDPICAVRDEQGIAAVGSRLLERCVFARELGEMRRPRQASPYLLLAFVFLLVLNVAIPKGGIAYGSAPVTFGYLALLGLAPVGLVYLISRSQVSSAAAANFVFGYVPVGALALLKIAYLGSSFALLLYSLVLVVLPAVMLLVYAPILEDLSDRQIGTTLVWCVRFTIVWGLMNFFIFAATRQLIEIPYVTVHPLDVGGIYQKNNRRGILMKLVSTYNNGNLFGVCLVMLFPIYVYFERSRAFIAAACLAVVLTLSRTVWFGLAGLVILMSMLRLVRVGRPSVWIAGGVLAFITVAIMPLMRWDLDRVVEARMGGRMMYWDELVVSFFGNRDIKIAEVLYAGVLQSFGLVGLLCALVAFAFPIGYGLYRLERLTVLQRSALAGVMAYLFMAFSDAAFIYPPTIVIFLFVVCLVYRTPRGAASATDRTVVSPAPHPATGALSLAQAARQIR